MLPRSEAAEIEPLGGSTGLATASIRSVCLCIDRWIHGLGPGANKSRRTGRKVKGADQAGRAVTRRTRGGP